MICDQGVLLFFLHDINTIKVNLNHKYREVVPADLSG